MNGKRLTEAEQAELINEARELNEKLAELWKQAGQIHKRYWQVLKLLTDDVPMHEIL